MISTTWTLCGQLEADKAEEARKNANAPKWHSVWANGFCPHVPTHALQSLVEELDRGGPRLIQEMTTFPHCLDFSQMDAVEFCCPVSYTALSDGLALVGEIHERFNQLCGMCDTHFSEPAACRFFLQAWDNEDKAEMCRELARVTREVLAERASLVA